jgi:hypothetical protein
MPHPRRSLHRAIGGNIVGIFLHKQHSAHTTALPGMGMFIRELRSHTQITYDDIRLHTNYILLHTKLHMATYIKGVYMQSLTDYI